MVGDSVFVNQTLQIKFDDDRVKSRWTTKFTTKLGWEVKPKSKYEGEFSKIFLKVGLSPTKKIVLIASMKAL